MKKIIIVAAALLILFLPLSSNYRWKANFLATSVACAAATTLVNGTGFTSIEIRVSNPGDPNIGLITLTFTRAAGSSSTVNFEFQVSFDGATTWSTAYYVQICIPTNETAVSNAVRVSKAVYFYGVSHIRLYRIVNGDPANNLTACNATLSF